MHTDEWKAKWRQPEPVHNVPTEWGWMVSYPKKLIIEDFVDIGAFTYIQASHWVHLQASVEIGSHCAIYGESSIDCKCGAVFIAEGACIGSHSTIMPGVNIGPGAIVAAHSFVNCDIPAGEIWGGVPAKFIKKVDDDRRT
jgi:acetyltransferase-like isoleucine patch superfamily enzyme